MLVAKPRKSLVGMVTGATGFIGSHLVRKLVRAGWEVHIISRATSSLPSAPEFTQVVNHGYDGSTQCMLDIVAQAKPNVVFHLASKTQSEHQPADVESLIQSNVLFGSQLLEAMKINRVDKFVNTGTFWQHYNNEEYNPVCLYAATKQAFEAILEYYVQACSIKAITLELFDTYGPDDPRPKLLHQLNKAAANGEALDMSAGEQLIDLVHIDDVVDAYLIAAQRLIQGKVSRHDTYAVSSGHPVPLKGIVQLYAEATKQIVPVNWGVRPYRYREVMVPWNQGEKLPEWQPRKNLIDGLSGIVTHRLMEWMPTF